MGSHSLKSGNPKDLKVLTTHDVGIALPMNTKYLSANPISRWLIRHFIGTMMSMLATVPDNTQKILDVGCGEGILPRQLRMVWPSAVFHGLDIDYALLKVATKLVPKFECVIGNKCTIHAGSVIGADGFGFAPQSESEFMKIPQIGNVIIEDNVEIGANVCIDRATIGSTIIRKGVKLDNLIQVAHNVEIGENTVMAGQSGIAGSTRIGKNCMFGGQVGVTGHITVADGTKVGAQTGIAGAVKKPDTILIGSPAMDMHGFMKSYAVFKKLPEIKVVVDKFERDLKKSDNQ